MQKNEISTSHTFSIENSYMFYFRFGISGPIMMVAKPTWINEEKDKILFQFKNGNRSESESINKIDILAVGDKKGTVQIVGWSGKYKILNQLLFDKYVKERIIKIKK